MVFGSEIKFCVEDEIVSSRLGHKPFKQLCSLLHSPWSPIKTCIKQRSRKAQLIPLRRSDRVTFAYIILAALPQNVRTIKA